MTSGPIRRGANCRPRMISCAMSKTSFEAAQTTREEPRPWPSQLCSGNWPHPTTPTYPTSPASTTRSSGSAISASGPWATKPACRVPCGWCPAPSTRWRVRNASGDSSGKPPRACPMRSSKSSWRTSVAAAWRRWRTTAPRRFLAWGTRRGGWRSISPPPGENLLCSKPAGIRPRDRTSPGSCVKTISRPPPWRSTGGSSTNSGRGWARARRPEGGVTGRKPAQDSRPVYSTDGGQVPLAPHNRKMAGPIPQPQRPGAPPDDGVVRVQRDKKGRGGKTATTITGLPGSESDLDALLKTLKQHCGAGGSREARTLVIQGDQRERLVEKLTALGHKAKLAGG
ncbi:MAG: hypothetical protein C0506_05060 [Anaerolinea sp.]|nr:hypothetical protein [Anaerolinea sp.]